MPPCAAARRSRLEYDVSPPRRSAAVEPVAAFREARERQHAVAGVESLDHGVVGRERAGLHDEQSRARRRVDGLAAAQRALDVGVGDGMSRVGRADDLRLGEFAAIIPV